MHYMPRLIFYILNMEFFFGPKKKNQKKKKPQVFLFTDSGDTIISWFIYI